MFNNIYIAMIDIDGTLKDLVKENNIALLSAMKKFNNVNRTLRGKFVLFINKINMYFVKSGLLPTNIIMQNILIFLYSVLLLKKYSVFKKVYFEEYDKQNIFFKGAENVVKEFYANDRKIFLVTKNKQNKNILSLYKSKIKTANKMKHSIKVIVGRRNFSKFSVYQALINNSYFIRNDEVIIIGDNFWDDILPAMFLGTKIIWVNKYNSKLKKVVIRLFKFLNKNILSEE